MAGQSAHGIALLDSATAAALAQILPVLLLTLTVEVRRHQLHQRKSRSALAAFFIAFGIVETVLVMSIDGSLYPFQWFDAGSALIIFGLLAMVFRLSLSEPDMDEGAPGVSSLWP
jgi:hypothetical protein